MTRVRRGGALVGVVLMSVLGVGCTEWLEVDDEEEVVEVPMGTPLTLPTAIATASGEGPFVPKTPGLRVPLSGYWTRARLDALDVLFTYTWISVDAGDGRLLLRLEAVQGQADAGYELGPSMKAIVPISLPPGTDATVLRDGFVLQGDGLTGSVVGLRTSLQDLWQVELTRLELVTVKPNLMVGALEGIARRGAQGQRGRRVLVSFVALRSDAPRPGEPPPPGPGKPPLPGPGKPPLPGPGKPPLPGPGKPPPN